MGLIILQHKMAYQINTEWIGWLTDNPYGSLLLLLLSLNVPKFWFWFWFWFQYELWFRFGHFDYSSNFILDYDDCNCNSDYNSDWVCDFNCFFFLLDHNFDLQQPNPN